MTSVVSDISGTAHIIFIHTLKTLLNIVNYACDSSVSYKVRILLFMAMSQPAVCSTQLPI